MGVPSPFARWRPQSSRAPLPLLELNSSSNSSDSTLSLFPCFHPLPNQLPSPIFITTTMHQSHDVDSHGHCLVSGPPASCSSHPTFPSSSLGTLSRLPPQIIDRILKLACRAPEKDAKSLKDRPLLALDKKTTLNLCVVSKAVSLIARYQLWESPRITRPSALLELRRTLLGHTCWGKLIKNLHIGGEEVLPYTDWPLMMEDKEDGVPLQFPVLWIQTSWGFEDEERLPKWCEPERTWCFDPWRLDCRGKAITAMLFDAMDGIDVEPYKRRYGKSGKRIGLVSRD